MHTFKYLIFIVLGVFMLMVSVPTLTTTRTLNKPDALVVESWIGGVNLEGAAGYIRQNEIKNVWISGVVSTKNEDGSEMPDPIDRFPKALIGNGYFTIYLSDSLDQTDKNIRLDLEGHKAKGYGAYYMVCTADTILKTGFVAGRDTILLKKNPFKNSVLYIAFLNDTYCKKGSDRNLIVHSVDPFRAVDRIEYAITGMENFPHLIPVNRDMFVQQYLFDLGCRNLHYNVITSPYSGNNKTLQSALNFKNRLREKMGEEAVLRLNVYTSRKHAKRTYLNYRNALKGIAEIGVICPEEKETDCDEPSQYEHLRSRVDEWASTVYTWFYWLFRR